MSRLPISSVFNDGYIAEVYESFRRDPSSVDESWRQFFRLAERIGGGTGAGTGAGTADPEYLRKVAAAAALVGAVQRYGHLAVQLDPLGTPPPGAAELTPEFHGITEEDLLEIPAAALRGPNDERLESGTAAELVHRLRELYCGGIGYEFEHLEEDGER
jgi:2-oxoglutarate dehydrogenase E1 component